MVAQVGGIVLAPGVQRLAQPEAQVQQGEVVLAGEVEDAGAGRESTGVDIRDARPTRGVFPQIEVERPGGGRIESLDGGDSDLHHSRLVDRLGESGRG